MTRCVNGMADRFMTAKYSRDTLFCLPSIVHMVWATICCTQSMADGRFVLKVTTIGLIYCVVRVFYVSLENKKYTRTSADVLV